MARFVKWIKDWGALVALLPMGVFFLIGVGEVRANVHHNAESVKRVEDAVSDALKTLREENARDHRQILDLIADLLKEAK